ncbi:hypothetical protein [Saccharothrix longispora]|uniref:hypothetical protein n=1 Tax=Saccharothrix longispora TaxID=33920 RepID=UPI0028FD2798|nr:hypothetical protein [Saccharothrix longispora]MBY8850413.1 hypothetical protein [Saccharothrix sp. MB29]MDU0287712.1 hypothetical protein [Saccharothrix longispora]
MPAAGTLTTWRRFLELIARDHPLVVVLRDVHLAGDEVLDAVERLADLDNPVPLLTVVSATPALLDRRPSWGGGKPHAASITLDPPRDGTVDRLRRVMLSTADNGPFGAGEPDPWPRRGRRAHHWRSGARTDARRTSWHWQGCRQARTAPDPDRTRLRRAPVPCRVLVPTGTGTPRRPRAHGDRRPAGPKADRPPRRDLVPTPGNA